MEFARLRGPVLGSGSDRRGSRQAGGIAGTGGGALRRGGGTDPDGGPARIPDGGDVAAADSAVAFEARKGVIDTPYNKRPAASGHECAPAARDRRFGAAPV